ncbi:hypothetical protein N7520_007497 [Penicillium odoratum]|uniref:uncharacterized protein n=1 Tax=Penicillium odoratum TaxID=1167516 RepID=UPI00254748CD|nr:uncharacterized protein N7520_007497 [Penicillium odoratum]KAJ5760341.1 hypothetical protein N7520_007497 [Penicillium odoratum]
MPPRRRAAANAQSALSFGSSRVTKPTATPTTLHKAKNLDSTATRKTNQSASATPEPSKPQLADLVVRQPEPKKIETAEEKQALQLSLKDLREYWGEKDSKKPVRVHEQGLSMEEKILRNFDLSSQYGPCIGLDRTKRWHRAQRLGLNPPIEVLTVLLKSENMSEQSHMEELVS